VPRIHSGFEINRSLSTCLVEVLFIYLRVACLGLYYHTSNSSLQEEFCIFITFNVTFTSVIGMLCNGNIANEIDVDMRQRIRARTTDTNHEKTTGEPSFDKQQCDECGRWFDNLSNHRKCSRRLRHTSHQDSTSLRTPRTGTTRKDVLKHKALMPKEKILLVCGILTTVIDIHWNQCIQLGSPKTNFVFNGWILSDGYDGWNRHV